GPAGFHFGILTGEFFPLVVKLLTAAEPQLQLRIAALEVERQWDERQPLLLHLPTKLIYLSPVQQQLARAPRLDVPPRPALVRVHVHVVDPYFAIFDTAEGVLKIGLTRPDRLNFRTD